MAKKYLQEKLTAGENITIKDNVISATGGGSGGVSKDYVDTQDQAVLKTSREELAGETLARTNADNAMQASIDVLEDVKATKAEVEKKQNKLTAGTNIKIENDVISATGGSGTPTHYLKTLNVSGNTMTFKKVVDGTEEDQSYTPNFDDKYVALTGDQTIYGVKNFPTNLQIAGKTVATEENLLAEQEARSKSVSVLSEALTNERNNRIDADNELQSSLNEEVLTRGDADVQLQTNINACEKTANKVSTIEASDTNYPTCNAVIAYISSLNGDDDQF